MDYQQNKNMSGWWVNIITNNKIHTHTKLKLQKAIYGQFYCIKIFYFMNYGIIFLKIKHIYPQILKTEMLKTFNIFYT